jgi:hypothetical protein
MNALLQAKLTQELKDSMVGHKREGARNDYAITELTVKTAYLEAFKFLTINGYGSQSRKVEQLAQQIEADKQALNQKIADMTQTNTQVMDNLNKRIAYLEDLLTKNSVEFKKIMGLAEDIAEIKTKLKIKEKVAID